MIAQVHILLGGIWGWDGYVTSAGMLGLASQIRAAGFPVTTWTWNNWEDAYKQVCIDGYKGKVAVIGYSGGGSRATWLANGVDEPRIDLMVGYDPSPRWQMRQIGGNVKKAICYYNTNPMMPSPYGMLGGGWFSGIDDITTVYISEQHLLVQADQSLHAKTIAAVKKCLAVA